MFSFNSLPHDTLHAIFEIACEIELVEESENYPIPLYFPYWETVQHTRRLKSFASRASQVCTLWEEVVRSSSLFWVTEHPTITSRMLYNHSGEPNHPDTRDSDIDVHQVSYAPLGSHALVLFEKYLFPYLERIRVLCIE